MARRTAVFLGVMAGLGLAFIALSGLPAGAQQLPYAPMPKAQCGPGSRPESGMQGLTTAAELQGPQSAYQCNLELMGQDVGEGLSWGGGALDTCAYVDQNSGPVSGKDGPSPKHAGTRVEDVSDPRHPKTAGYLDNAGMLEPNESLQTNAARKLLVGFSPYYVFDDARTATRDDEDLSVYDVSNCRQPVLKGSLKLPHTRGHGGYFAPDGRTFYLTSFTGNIPVNDKIPTNDRWRHTSTDAFIGIDISDPTHPREILRWVIPQDVGASHQLAISLDGNRVYLGLFGRQNGTDGPDVSGTAVLDISAVQARQPNPKVTLLGRDAWTDGGGMQGMMEVRVKGQPYLLGSSSGVGGLPFSWGSGVAREACYPTSTTDGYIAVLDVRDGHNPKLASRIALETTLPSNCAKIKNEPGTVTGGPAFCAVDDPTNARLLACGFGSAGLRVFDIRNPQEPREVAYYKPPAGSAAPLPGSYNNLRWATDRATQAGHVRADGTQRVLAVRRDSGQIWIMSHENGFQVLQLTDSFKKAEPSLF